VAGAQELQEIVFELVREVIDDLMLSFPNY
jgi:hypothetical protein